MSYMNYCTPNFVYTFIHLSTKIKLNSNLKKESEIKDKCTGKQNKNASQKEIQCVNMPSQINIYIYHIQ